MGYCIFLRKGETHTTPSTGILASDLAVGDIVKLTESGTAVEYIVVNQGIPENSSLYDSSCNGTWLLRKDIHSNRIWNSNKDNDYANSDINTWLNGDFFNSLGTIEKATIRQIKIPYGQSTINSGANGLNVKIFLLGAYELGWTTDTGSGYFPEDGVKISYFDSGIGSSADDKRVAYLNASKRQWWMRSPITNRYTQAWYVNTDGDYSRITVYDVSYGIRPALILPFTAKFNETTKILKG